MSHEVTSDFLALQAALAGRYSLQHELGRGGMGIVYLAHEVSLDRPVALKVLPTEVSADASARERFLQEARTAAKLSHPNIVPIFTVDEVGDFVFYAMAPIDGETLGERIRSRGPLSDAEATRLVTELAWGLGYAHAQGVVHRDVKPDNVLIERYTGRALIMDFGIAQVGASPSPSAADGELADRVQGTAEFMSPEQARGAQVDHRTDLYSLGVLAFYAVTGRTPFEAASPSVVLAKHVTEPAPPVASIAPHVPTHLARTIDRCLRKEPGDRFQDGGGVADALSRATVTQRQLPVALRVFIKHLRETTYRGSASATALLLWLIPMLFVFGMLISAPFLTLFGGLIGGGAILGGSLAWRSRKVLKAGHTLEDVRLALEQDVMRRNEEFRFDVGERVTHVDVWAKRLAITSLLSGTASLTLGAFAFADAFVPLGTLMVMFGIGSALFAASRARRRADVTGERWLKLLNSRVGEWVFRLGGWGLDRTELIAAGPYRPTEMAISISAARLFEELPKETRKSLGDLPDTVSKLEADARMLRKQLAELNAVLSELGDDPSAPGAEARDRVRGQVVDTRDEAERKLKEVVTRAGDDSARSAPHACG